MVIGGSAAVLKPTDRLAKWMSVGHKTSEGRTHCYSPSNKKAGALVLLLISHKASFQ